VSINAEFVAVSPDELADFIDDPSSIMDLFMPAGVDAFSSLMTGPTRDRLLALSPETIAQSVVGTDPQVQAILTQRIAAMQQMLATNGGDAPLTALLGGDRGTGGSAATSGRRRRLSIDKAWHGLHFLLIGDAESTDGELGPVVLGGTEIGEDEGYGPARYFEPGEVAALAAALDRDGVEDEIAARYDPARMTELSIYPFGWEDDEEDEREWLLDAFREVRAFYRDAAADGSAVVTCFV
jgi:hypothetical protein